MNRGPQAEVAAPIRVSRAAMAALASELRAALQGPVRFDDASRALYATDASNYRQVPLGVVMPRDAGEVEATLAVNAAMWPW